MNATIIQFIDCDFRTGMVELMVGLKNKTVEGWQYDSLLLNAEIWNTGLRKVSRAYQPTVLVFDERRAHRADGICKAIFIAGLLDLAK